MVSVPVVVVLHIDWRTAVYYRKPDGYKKYDDHSGTQQNMIIITVKNTYNE